MMTGVAFPVLHLFVRICVDDFRIYCYYKMYLYIKDSYHTFVHTLNMLRYVQGD